MKPMDGNSDDKTGFFDPIQTHIKQLMTAQKLKYIISDSALYNDKSLQTLAKNPDIHWISRVPSILNEAKEAIEKAELSEMTVIDEQTRFEVKVFARKNFNLEIKQSARTMLALSNGGLLFILVKLQACQAYN
jgi:transposase